MGTWCICICYSRSFATCGESLIKLVRVYRSLQRISDSLCDSFSISFLLWLWLYSAEMICFQWDISATTHQRLWWAMCRTHVLAPTIIIDTDPGKLATRYTRQPDQATLWSAFSPVRALYHISAADRCCFSVKPQRRHRVYRERSHA